ncbi:MAG: zinc protease [Gammaproteobacteria bacterium]|jgi:zinc protease
MGARITFIIYFLSIVTFSQSTLATPDIQKWQSEMGANVFFVEAKEIPIVDIQIIFDAGSARDGEQAGLAALTNGLLDEGADGLTADQISQGFDDVGASYGGSADYDSASVSLRSLTDPAMLLPALDNLARVLVKPDFPEDAMTRQKNRTLIGIRNKQQSPGALASDAFFAEVFKGHPYAVASSGTEESVSALQRRDVVAFHKNYYVTKNATIAIVGDLTKEQAQVMVEKLLKELPVGEKPTQIPTVPVLEKAATVKIEHPSSQTHILLGQTGLKRGDADYFALYVGNHVLGGGGMVSRLFAEIREKRGLSYGANSYFSPMRENGTFTASLQTRTDQAEEALEVLQDNLERFIDLGPTEAELEASKKNITGGFPLRLASNSKIVGYIAMIGFYGLEENYLDTFNTNVNAVTVDQIKDAFKRRLSPDKFVTVMVGPISEKDRVEEKAQEVVQPGDSS